MKINKGDKEEVEEWICKECEGVVAAPEVSGWEATKQVGRTIMSLLGGGAETAKVATDSFYGLTGRLLSGEQVSFDMFKGKVLLVVNVATK